MNLPRIPAVWCLCFILSLAGCTAGRRTQLPVTPAVPDSAALLRSDLDRIFADPGFANAQWGVEIQSLDRAEPVYEKNSTRLYMPASNNKLLTSAAALSRLGPGFNYETRVEIDGPIADATLKGNLVVVGSGDPSNAPRFQEGDPFLTFKGWAARLKEMGVMKIDGDLLGDEAAFEADMLGSGWEWDDVTYGYAAPVSALQFNENLETIEISPSGTEGAAATVTVHPLEKYLSLDNKIVTAGAGARANILIERGEGREQLVLKGQVPLNGKPQTRAVAVESPTSFYLAALRLVLEREGVDVSHCSLRAVRNWNPPSLRLLWIHLSPTLADIIKPLLKVSQNLYAETLTRTLGLKFHGEGTFALGKEVVEGALHDMAIEEGTYYYADGSGLSRRNLITADLLVRILKFMYRQPYFQQFYDSLPIAGVDGTIYERMKGTKAEGNVHAKTGSIAYVRSLSGYVRTADGEMLAFSMIANNFLVTSRMAEYVQDSALERLAAFTRK